MFLFPSPCKRRAAFVFHCSVQISFSCALSSPHGSSSLPPADRDPPLFRSALLSLVCTMSQVACDLHGHVSSLAFNCIPFDRFCRPFSSPFPTFFASLGGQAMVVFLDHLVHFGSVFFSLSPDHLDSFTQPPQGWVILVLHFHRIPLPLSHPFFLLFPPLETFPKNYRRHSMFGACSPQSFTPNDFQATPVRVSIFVASFPFFLSEKGFPPTTRVRFFILFYPDYTVGYVSSENGVVLFSSGRDPQRFHRFFSRAHPFEFCGP